MNAVRIFVALLILLVSSPPAFARVPGCINGLLLNPMAYVFYVINRQVGQPAADWEAVLQASGIPATSSVPGTVATAAFFGITQWKGSAGNVRGRLSLPTATPDALGYLTRSVDILADNPAWPVKCWQDARACVWAWREHVRRAGVCASSVRQVAQLSRMISTATAAVIRLCSGRATAFGTACLRTAAAEACSGALRPTSRRQATTMATAKRTSRFIDHRPGTGSGLDRSRTTLRRTPSSGARLETFPCRPTTMAIESTTSRFTGHRTGPGT